MKKINRSKLVLNRDVVRVLSKGDLVDVAGALPNWKTKLDQCVSIDGYTCWYSCAGGCL